MNIKEEEYLYWLNNIQGIGKKKIEKLLYVKKTARGIYEAGPALIEQLDFLTKGDKLAIVEAMGKGNVDEEYKKLREKKISFLYPSHDRYPKRLKEIPDPPHVLYFVGNMPDDSQPSVAVIGARKCSEYGRYVARELGKRLAVEGIQVVSGLARGIDSEAQRAAIEAGGKVYGVLGCGVDICYPEESRDIYEKMKNRGGIISEYPPRTEPKSNLFPLRNRIISGLADVVVVVEAKEKSGTLITVDMALEQGKEVYVIPGRVTDPLSIGCNRLIKQGAEVLNDLNEFIFEVKSLAACRRGRENTIRENRQDETETKVTASRNNQKNTVFEKKNVEKRMENLKHLESSFYELGQEVVDILYLGPKTMQQIYSQLTIKREIELSKLAELLYEMENMYILHKTDGFYNLK